MTEVADLLSSFKQQRAGVVVMKSLKNWILLRKLYGDMGLHNLVPGLFIIASSPIFIATTALSSCNVSIVRSLNFTPAIWKTQDEKKNFKCRKIGVSVYAGYSRALFPRWAERSNIRLNCNYKKKNFRSKKVHGHLTFSVSLQPVWKTFLNYFFVIRQQSPQRSYSKYRLTLVPPHESIVLGSPRCPAY